MSSMYVTAYESALNFRSAPEVAPGNLIGSLFLLQEVEVLDDAPNDFVRCRAHVNGEPLEGFASRKFLRLPTTPNREALLARVHAEFMRFERGLGKEHVKPFSGYVGEMWKALRINHLDGTDRDVPWSAAAISFMVRGAGQPYSKFKFAAAHSKFTHHAIRARERNDTSVPFWGFRLHEQRPRIGDIVVRDNPDHGPAIDYEAARQSDSYRSHSDIIVHIDDAGQQAVAIGGNVSHSVGIALYDLAPGNFLAPTRSTFALLTNRTDDAA